MEDRYYRASSVEPGLSSAYLVLGYVQLLQCDSMGAASDTRDFPTNEETDFFAKKKRKKEKEKFTDEETGQTCFVWPSPSFGLHASIA